MSTSGLQEPRSTLTKAKICGTVLGGAAISFQGPSAGVTDPSVSSGLVGWRLNNPSPDCSGEVQGRWSVDRSVSNVRATGVWVCLIWRATGLLKNLHTWADP